MQITDGYSLFFHCWPWMGLGAAIVLLILAFTTNALRSDPNRPRWKDPSFVAWIGAVAYMLHNFEEYGVSFTGETLHFANMMGSMITPDITEWAFLGCNIPLVWIMGPALAALSFKRPELVGAMPVFELVNGLGHAAQMANLGYNPGAVTSLLVFIPLGIYTIVAFYGKRAGKFAWKYFWLTLAVALFYTACIGIDIVLAYVGILTGAVMQFLFIASGTALAGWLYWRAAKNAKPNAVAKA